MRVKPKAAVAAFVLIATAFQAFANEVTLKNGDRVSGKIISRTDEAIVIEPGDRALVPTGLRIALPTGFEAQVRPRSGLAVKHGVTVLNSPGTIDADYRGEVRVLLVNLGAETAIVRHGERIAQLVVAPLPRVGVVEVARHDATPRGDGGFGSTGTA